MFTVEHLHFGLERAEDDLEGPAGLLRQGFLRTQEFELIRSGRSSLIVGPAGSGKSRLGQWLGVRAHELGAAVQLATRHTPEGEGGMRAALRRMFPIDLRDWDAEPGLGTRLQERGLAPPVARDVAAWLARDVVEQVGGGQEGWWELAADALFAVHADRIPVVLVDDVHHGVDTLRYVRWMLTSHRLVPGVFVLVAEDEALMELPESEELLQQIEAMEGVVTLELGPLSEQARTALARRVLPLEPSLAAELAERTDGSPGYTVEMLHDLAERGVLERGPRGLRLREGEQLSSPQQLSSLWEDHLARVLEGHPEWREPLEVAAVLGTQLDTELWREACARLGQEAPFDLLDALVEARLARPMTNAVRFSHPMMCDAIAEEVTDGAVFRACAEVLTGVDDARAGAAWARAGDLQRALDGWMRQAERFRRGQPGRLETLVTRIRDAADEILERGDPRWTEVYDLQVRLALDRGRSSDALAAASRLWEVADDDRSQLLAHIAMSRASLDLLDHRGALRHARAAGELVERRVVEDRPTLAVELVGVAITLGQLADAERWLAECRSTPSTDLEQARLALAHGQAAAAAERTRWLGAKATGDRSLRARAALCEGYARLALGSHEEALTAFQAARRRFRALGLVTEAVASIGLAVTLDALKHQDEALRVLDTLHGHALGPRLAWKVALGEVVVRVSRPQDVTFGLWWRKVRQGLEVALSLDPVDALVLRHGVPRAAKGDRATELSEALHRFR
ncbi:MAG: hypothetical protein KC621_20475 [Myxococcales bacterium]|nr:hypothetical protein [Myxococcales bacterium]